MTETAADRFHPVVGFAYCTAVLAVTMLFLHPLYIAAGLICACIVNRLLGARFHLKTLLWGLPAFLLIVLFNVLVSRGGRTPLFTVGGSTFTSEALFYGICSCGMLLCVLLWFAVYNRIVTPEKFLFLFSRAAPSACMLVTMTQRLIPLFTARARNISDTQKTLGNDISRGRLRRRFRSGLRILSVLIGWSMEDGLDTADSMKARGYGVRKRTFFSPYRFRPADAAGLIVIAACFAVCLWGYYAGIRFRFYPVVRMSPLGAAGIASLCAFLVLALLPAAVSVRESIRMRNLQSSSLYERGATDATAQN